MMLVKEKAKIDHLSLENAKSWHFGLEIGPAMSIIFIEIGVANGISLNLWSASPYPKLRWEEPFHPPPSF